MKVVKTLYKIRHTNDYSPSSDLDVKPLVGRVFEGKRTYRNNEMARAITNRYMICNGVLLFYFVCLEQSFEGCLYAVYRTRHTHNFAPSSDLALKPLVDRVFVGERPYINNERDGAIDNR